MMGEAAAQEQARAWQRRRIVASDYPRLREKLYSAPSLSAVADDDDDGDFDDFSFRGGASHVLAAADAIDLIREAANHYPHPAAGLLLDAALALLVPQIEPWSIGGAPAEGVGYETVDDIIRKILEDPDALLG